MKVLEPWEEECLVRDCENFLKEWNKKYLSDHFIPRGNEPDYLQAKACSDYIAEKLADIPI